MDLGTLVFVVVRVVHVVSAVLWVSFAVFLTFIAQPALHAAGSEGGKLQSWLFGNSRIGIIMSAASALTILAGIYLFLADSKLFRDSAWLGSPTGIFFSLGALLGLVAGAIGGRRMTRALKELTAVGQDIAKAEADPPADLVAKFKTLQTQMFKTMRVTTYIVLLALVCMAFAGSLPTS